MSLLGILGMIGGQKVAAIILAAGVGRRLKSWDLPKALLSFDGSTLLARHLRALHRLGVEDINITGGHEVEALSQEARRISERASVVFNEHYMRGSLLSLHAHAGLLRSGKSIILMDADVLVSGEILKILVQSQHANSLLIDMGSVDDEAVKICYLDGLIVDFHKRPVHAYDRCGESVGFFKLSPATAAALADRCDHYLAQGMLDLEYEMPLRDVMIKQPETFGAENITGMPWIEIDFDEDLERANREILPQLKE
jgi:choline kinase